MAAFVDIKDPMLVTPLAPVPTPVLLVALLQLKVKLPPVAALAGVIVAWVPPLQDVVLAAVGAAFKVIFGTTVMDAEAVGPGQETLFNV